ncbi:MAG: NUDIX domain-containing protein [Candidatus Heimdallarchaeota archaeon]
MTDDEGRFLFAVAAILENPQGKILLLKRGDYNKSLANIWDVVGGGVDQLEDPFIALTREIREETGINNFELIKALDVFSYFENNNNNFPGLIGITFWCKTSERKIILSHEHTEYKWLEPHSALEISEHPVVTQNIKQFIDEKKRLNLISD